MKKTCAKDYGNNDLSLGELGKTLGKRKYCNWVLITEHRKNKNIMLLLHMKAQRCEKADFSKSNNMWSHVTQVARIRS